MENRRSVNLVNQEKHKRGLIFINQLENEKDIDKKIKLLVDMMTYYDKNNAENFANFCINIYQDRAIHSRDCKLQDKIKELQSIMDN